MREQQKMKHHSKQVRVTITKLDGSGSIIAPVSSPLPGDIHIWEFRSEMPGARPEDIAALLSPDERERAARFHFQRDAQRFTVTRARTRAILGAYLQSDPRELKFTYSAREKPSLSNASADIRFNVSHSGDQALVAVAKGREIGIDIEQIRSNVECEQLAERFFSLAERKFMRDLPDDQKLRTFFRLWTCKEAFLKAHGIGLSRPLSSFDVSLEDGPGLLLRIKGDAGEENRWSLVELESVSRYPAAAVVDGPLEAVRYRLL
jgi:4'-phosphopantetheinyl transferase